MEPLGIAQYKCQKCTHEFSRPPHPVTCPDCGSRYVDWVNYEEWRKVHDKSVDGS